VGCCPDQRQYSNGKHHIRNGPPLKNRERERERERERAHTGEPERERRGRRSMKMEGAGVSGAPCARTRSWRRTVDHNIMARQTNQHAAGRDKASRRAQPATRPAVWARCAKEQRGEAQWKRRPHGASPNVYRRTRVERERRGLGAGGQRPDALAGCFRRDSHRWLGRLLRLGAADHACHRVL